jgi:hypothetical protein
MGRQKEQVVNAWLWVANPERKWNEASGLSPWDALHQYLSGEYVYWSTPAYQRDINVGDRAYMARPESLLLAKWAKHRNNTMGIMHTYLLIKIGLKRLAGTRQTPRLPGKPG